MLYVAGGIIPFIASLPFKALDPDHAPDAVQEVALSEDQVRVVRPLCFTDVGLAVRVTEGMGTEMFTVAGALVPPGPVQVIVYILSEVISD